MQGAIIFFILPLGFFLTTSVIDVSEYIPATIFAALRFIGVVSSCLLYAHFLFEFYKITNRDLGRISGKILCAFQMLLELNAPQFGLVFVLRNATHRQILIRRLLSLVDRFRPNIPKVTQPALTWVSSEVATH